MQINTGNSKKQLLFDLPEDEMLTPMLEQINDLLHDEKKARHENDHNKLADVCTRIIQMCADNKEWAKVRYFLVLLCKRRGQAKKPIVDMVEMCQKGDKLFNKLPSKEEKFKMLETIRDACDGKMFLEREYADSTKRICMMLEEDGKAEEATKIIQEIQIETYGSLEIKEKVEFILYQMKLVLARKDFVRVQILSRKISSRHIGEKGLENLKVQFFLNMTKYYIHEKMMIDIAKSYKTIFDTLAAATEEELPALQAIGITKEAAFQNFALYLLCSPYTDEKVEMMDKSTKDHLRDYDLESAKSLKVLVDFMLNWEIQEIKQSDFDSFKAREPFCESTENHMHHQQQLISQLIQHNLRIVEKYYSKINIATLERLIGGVNDIEKELADMVVNGKVSAKINRMNMTVTFTKKKFTNDRLNDWNTDIRSLLGKIEQTCHLINREKVVHQ